MKSLVLAAALAMGLAAPAAAAPQPVCAPADAVIAKLKEHHFTPQKKHTDEKTGITYRLLASNDGSWVIVTVSPDGSFICVVNAGSGYDPGVEV